MENEKNPKAKRTRRRKYSVEQLDQVAEKLIEWYKKPKNFWLKDFAIEQKMSWKHFTEKGQQSEKLAAALELAKDMQESKLVKLGMSKENNVSMVIFSLKNVAGWRDVSDVNVTQGVKVIRDTI